MSDFRTADKAQVEIWRGGEEEAVTEAVQRLVAPPGLNSGDSKLEVPPAPSATLRFALRDSPFLQQVPSIKKVQVLDRRTVDGRRYTIIRRVLVSPTTGILDAGPNRADPPPRPQIYERNRDSKWVPGPPAQLCLRGLQ